MRWMSAAAMVVGLAACDGGEQGVGFGPDSYASSPGGGPQPTSASFDMGGLAPLPSYTFASVGTNSPADALTAGGGTTLRGADQNLGVDVEGRRYLMRQITLGDNVYVVAEGAGPVASLPDAIRARTGCLIVNAPLRSGDATIYTLNCR